MELYSRRSGASYAVDPFAPTHWFRFAPMVRTVPVTSYVPGVDVSTSATSQTTGWVAVPRS